MSADEIEQEKLVASSVNTETISETVWVVASRKEDSPHPYVEAVYDNEEAAREHKKKLANNSFKHGVVAWGVFERNIQTKSDQNE